MNLRRIAAFMRKESIDILRDPVTLGVALVMPLILLFLFGYAITLDVKDIRLGVLDFDRTHTSRELVERFVRSGYFRLAHTATSEADLEDAIQEGRIRAALILPPGFSRSMQRGTPHGPQLVVDGTYSATAAVILAYARGITFSFPEPPQAFVRPVIRAWYNPELRSANYVIPGLFAVILMAFPPMLTALAITREKELGTIQQVFASPLTAAEFLVAKLVPYGVIAFIELLMVMAFGFLWFAVPNNGSLTLLALIGFLYVFCTVGLGLAISAITRSQLIAMLLALIISLMPSFLFSGFLFPIFTMPGLLQLYAHIFPATYFMEVSRGVVLRGATLTELWPNLAILTGYVLVLFLIGLTVLKKKVA